ncbi:hypothetical protein T01_9290 [Trichinella spiralis]|uniref:Uncharacterized protein n=1 Tax=Trichinella spiralis TaxID=6334 RepID=A0A0V1ASU4_TRISP|nr:hypothetical protein T01_9290 [Trichinella spiralis]
MPINQSLPEQSSHCVSYLCNENKNLALDARTNSTMLAKEQRMLIEILIICFLTLLQIYLQTASFLAKFSFFTFSEQNSASTLAEKSNATNLRTHIWNCFEI